MPGIATSVAVIEGDKVLLTKRDDFEVWCLPGGGVEQGESLAQGGEGVAWLQQLESPLERA